MVRQQAMWGWSGRLPNHPSDQSGTWPEVVAVFTTNLSGILDVIFFWIWQIYVLTIFMVIMVWYNKLLHGWCVQYTF